MAPDMPVQGGGPLQDERRGELLVEGVSKWFRTRQDTVHALDDIHLHVRPGEFV